MELGDCVEAVLVMGRVAEPAAAILVVFHIWNSAASPHGVSVPLVPPSSTASVPLAPPAGIAAPAHPPAPSSASAAFSPPSEGNRGAPPPHRFHIGRPPCGKERMVGEVKREGAIPIRPAPCRRACTRRSRARRTPWPPGARAYRGVPAAVVRATVHACDAAPPERVLLHAALRRVGKLNRPRRIRRRLQGVCKKGLTGG